MSEMDSAYRYVAGTGQTLAIGASSVASAAFGANTQFIRITASGNCHVVTGTAPTATANDMLLKSTDPSQVIKVNGGDKIAVIQDGASTGSLNVVEVSG